MTACSAPLYHVADSTDCDDLNPAVSPIANEVCNGIDDDCDRLIDILDDSITDATTFFVDNDRDGFGLAGTAVMACEATVGMSTQDGDCNDDDDIAPDQPERCSTVGIDDNCDGRIDEDSAIDALTFYAESDNDGWGDPDTTAIACAAPAGFVAVALDCAPDDGNTHPGAIELCNDIDDDCDGEIDISVSEPPTHYLDQDDDGYGSDVVLAQTCPRYAPAFAATNSDDCDDNNPLVNPEQPERCASVGVDDNCNGAIDEDSAIDVMTWYRDLDGDGFGEVADSLNACVVPSTYVSDKTDCDDSLAIVYFGAEELCDGLDTDCAGGVLEINVPTDIATIQGAIDASSDGDLICVEPGDYTENLNYNGHNVRVASYDGPNETRLLIDPSSDTVVFANGETAQAGLEGFTFFLEGGSYDRVRSAMTIINAEPVLRELKFRSSSIIRAEDCAAFIVLNNSDAVLDGIDIDTMRWRCEHPQRPIASSASTPGWGHQPCATSASRQVTLAQILTPSCSCRGHRRLSTMSLSPTTS